MVNFRGVRGAEGKPSHWKEVRGKLREVLNSAFANNQEQNNPFSTEPITELRFVRAGSRDTLCVRNTEEEISVSFCRTCCQFVKDCLLLCWRTLPKVSAVSITSTELRVDFAR